MHFSCKWFAVAITFCLLFSGCQSDEPAIQPPASSTSSSSFASSETVSQPSSGFFPRPVPTETVHLKMSEEYDLQVAAETAVRADVDATALLQLSLDDFMHLNLPYVFSDSDVQPEAHPTDKNLLLFYHRDINNNVSRMYQYNLETQSFILLNQLGFSATEEDKTFWADNVFCHLSNITSSDEQINLDRALCCFNTDTNKWAFYPMDEKKQAIPMNDGNILIISPRFDGSREIRILNPVTMEEVNIFSISGKLGLTSFAYICPDDTIIFASITSDGTVYSRYTTDGTLILQCLGNPDLPYEELIFYRLYKALPLAAANGEAPVLTAFTLNGKDYVMPWRPTKAANVYPMMYARQEMRAWNGLHLLSREDGWSLWLPQYTVKNSPDFLLWKEETNYWQYVKLDTENSDLTILRSIPIAGNRVLFLVCDTNNNVEWKLLDFSDFYPLPEESKS